MNFTYFYLYSGVSFISTNKVVWISSLLLSTIKNFNANKTLDFDNLGYNFAILLIYYEFVTIRLRLYHNLYFLFDMNYDKIAFELLMDRKRLMYDHEMYQNNR